jgi:hypothetical protein
MSGTEVTPALERRDKILILLAEYNTLRTECQHRLTLFIQSTGIAITVVVGLVGVAITNAQFPALYYLGGGALLLYAVLVALIDINVAQLAKRVVELEGQINGIAGERLLKWETEYGWGRALFPSRYFRRKADK